MTASSALEPLPPPLRLALAYAPRHSREKWRGLLELDHRLGQIVRLAREPILAQMRLAWWRDRLREPAEARPLGEPTLALLASWEAQSEALVALVDGWEAMLGDPPQPALLAEGRGAALAALGELLGEVQVVESIRQVGKEWSMADVGQELDRKSINLPGTMRPLAILYIYEQYRGSGIGGFIKMIGAILSNR